MKPKKGLTNRKLYDAIQADLLDVTLDNQTRKRGMNERTTTKQKKKNIKEQTIKKGKEEWHRGNG